MENSVAGHRIISVETLHEGWGKLLLLRIELPDRHVLKREVEDHGPAVAVLPYDPERRLAVLVRQFRAPVFNASGKADVLEAPAGMLDEGDPEACARREAAEEVGLALGALDRARPPRRTFSCGLLPITPFRREANQGHNRSVPPVEST